MDNIGKALTMAGFALLFVFAASAAIYLYSSVTSYLVQGVKSTSIDYRAEGQTTDATYVNYKRNIDASEILITLSRMKQMHVKSLTVISGGESITFNDTVDIESPDPDMASDMQTFVNSLSNRDSFSYSFHRNGDGTIDVTYTAN